MPMAPTGQRCSVDFQTALPADGISAPAKTGLRHIPAGSSVIGYISSRIAERGDAESWHEVADRGSATSRQILRVERTWSRTSRDGRVWNRSGHWAADEGYEQRVGSWPLSYDGIVGTCQIDLTNNGLEDQI